MNPVSKLRTIIIDDAAKARRLLSLILEEYLPEVEILGEAANVDEALVLIHEHRPDFILLDIEMPGQSGIDLAEQLAESELNCDIIFTTAYNEYAIKAFRLSAIDYLLKPINELELVQSIEKVKNKRNLLDSNRRLKTLSQNLNPNNPSILCMPVLNGFEYIPVKDIEYIEASGSYANIALTNGSSKTISKNLKFFEDTLQYFTQFIRVHRSCLINLEQLKLFSKSDSGTIILNSGKTVSLSRDRKPIFMEILQSMNRKDSYQ